MQPTDTELLDYITAHPRRSLADICARFGVPYTAADGYTPEAKAVANQLQRLRRARKIRSDGQRWVRW